jgi:hypothetical protein
MAKITPRKSKDVIVAKTRNDSNQPPKGSKWWKAQSKAQRALEAISTFSYIKEQQQYRYRQSGIYARLYGNMPLFNYAGYSTAKMGMASNLPIDRPTMNVIQSCIDTLTSRVTQSRPRPVFLTDNADYKQRNMAKQMNTFINGELYQTKAHQMGELMLRDAEIFGTGCVKIYETSDHKVGLDRVLQTDILVDPNESMYGFPRQMFHPKLVDREMLADNFPEYRSIIEKAEQAYPAYDGDSARTIADQVMAVEAWHLPSSKDADDGLHIIACSAGSIFEEPWTKDKFPFVFLPYSPGVMGFWGQGLCEQLMGTQVEINKLLIQISQSLSLVGVPRVFIESGSKVVKAHLNSNIGAIVEYSGVKPIYEVAPCIPQELYAQLQRLVEYAYQQAGVSAMSAAAQKPQGLNSGEAIRNYDDLQSDRFAALVRRYDNMYVELAYQILDLASDIAARDGKYQTVYPDKNGTKQIDLPKLNPEENPFVIQCFDASSLPRDPAGRLQKITEMMQAGIISVPEGRRLLDYPDIEQVDKLANAPEERILKILDDIVDSGKYTPPDPFMDLMLATQLVTQYYNLYESCGLEESKCQKLRDFFTQVNTLKQAAQPPPPASGPAPQANPEALPTNPMIPNAPMGAA